MDENNNPIFPPPLHDEQKDHILPPPLPRPRQTPLQTEGDKFTHDVPCPSEMPC